jgi:superoxide reductase
MAKLLGIYKCEVCGNIVEVLFEGVGELVCCGQPMKLMLENSVEASYEKHIPVGAREGTILTVKVGSAPHPMTEEHYIQWSEILVERSKGRFWLNDQRDGSPRSRGSIKGTVLLVV